MQTAKDYDDQNLVMDMDRIVGKLEELYDSSTCLHTIMKQLTLARFPKGTF